jgi:hypothetical protein
MIAVRERNINDLNNVRRQVNPIALFPHQVLPCEIKLTRLSSVVIIG